MSGFDIFVLVLMRLEEDETVNQQASWLTELFIADMDGQLRQIGIGDMARATGAIFALLAAQQAGKADL